MRKRDLIWVIAAPFVLTTLLGCGGGGGGSSPTGPPSGHTYVSVHMMKETLPGSPSVELSSAQGTVPLTLNSDALQLSDPSFDAVLEADLNAIADQAVPALKELVDDQLGGDALLPPEQQVLGGNGSCTQIFFTGGPFSTLFWPDPLRIQNHGVTNATYFQSEVRLRLKQQLFFFVKEQGGRLHRLKDVKLWFIFELAD